MLVWYFWIIWRVVFLVFLFFSGIDWDCIFCFFKIVIWGLDLIGMWCIFLLVMIILMEGLGFVELKFLFMVFRELNFKFKFLCCFVWNVVYFIMMEFIEEFCLCRLGVFIFLRVILFLLLFIVLMFKGIIIDWFKVLIFFCMLFMMFFEICDKILLNFFFLFVWRFFFILFEEFLVFIEVNCWVLFFCDLDCRDFEVVIDGVRDLFLRLKLLFFYKYMSFFFK